MREAVAAKRRVSGQRETVEQGCELSEVVGVGGGGEAGKDRPFTPPALLLLCGLYDLPLLAEPTSPEFVQYREILRDMVAEAFGPEGGEVEKSEVETGTNGGSIWRRASPALALLNTKETAAFQAEIPSTTHLICLATSSTDGLVPPEQGEVMLETLRALGWAEEKSGESAFEGKKAVEGVEGVDGAEVREKTRKQDKRLMQLEVMGQHDVIWEEGGEMARAVWATLDVLEKQKQREKERERERRRES